MKALVKHAAGAGGMSLQDIAEPAPQKGELKLKVLAAGICGKDMDAYKDEDENALTVPIGHVFNMPVVLGHEFVGQVTEVGEGVEDFSVGDWVSTIPACYSCGECELCRAGLLTMCAKRKSIGGHVDGAMAEYLVVAAKYSFKIPDTVEDKLKFALAEPLGCVVRGIYQKLNVMPGQLCVVCGPGPMGLFSALLLKHKGAYVIVHGLSEDSRRLEIAKQLGADEVTDSVEELKKIVRAHSAKGADLVIDASGSEQGLDACLECVRLHGTLLELGHMGERIVPVHFDLIIDKEINFVNSNSTELSTWPIVYSLLSQNLIDVSPLISTLPLEKWREGFESMLHKECGKLLLLP